MGVPGKFPGAPWELPAGFLRELGGSPALVRHREPKKCPKCVTVVRKRDDGIPAGTLRYPILGPPGESLFYPTVKLLILANIGTLI